MARFLDAGAIGDEDLSALPVKALPGAIEFYRKVLGFDLVARDSETATLARDAVRLGLVTDSDHDPGRAGSLAIEVDDLVGLHVELTSHGAAPGEFGVDEWNGKSHQTFFVRESANGYCYCFYRPLP